MGRTKTSKDSVKKSKHSLNPDRSKSDAAGNMRDRKTIKRLQMYRNYKAKRDANGKIIRPAPFQSTLASGSMSRVEPNRRWFGNTRVVDPNALQSFQDALGKAVRDPFQVVLRKTKMPVTLLNEKKKNPVRILDSESFEYTFGKKMQRKRPRMAYTDVSEMAKAVEEKAETYDPAKDLSLAPTGEKERVEASDPQFRAGQSRRVWNELFKVLDSADVVLYVLDARDPQGTRSPYIERFLREEKPHKHLVFVLNKIDLVPIKLTRAWKKELCKEFPTIAFHADIKKPFGKGALINLLRQFGKLHAKDKQQISVGIIGYPNVGKSSVINALRSEKVCNVAPIAGETKVWQYVTLMRTIYLIDCPGVVYPEQREQQLAAEQKGEAEAELVLRGVVRVEYLRNPDLYIPALLDRVKHDYLRAHYVLGGSGQWRDATEFLEALARRSGKLLRAAEPDVVCAAKMVLNDFQRGRLPWFVAPPGMTEEDLLALEMPHEAGVRDKVEREEEEEVEVDEEEEDENEKKESETKEGQSLEEKSDEEGDEDDDLEEEEKDEDDDLDDEKEQEEEDEEQEEREEEEEEPAAKRRAVMSLEFVPLKLPVPSARKAAPEVSTSASQQRHQQQQSSEAASGKRKRSRSRKRPPPAAEKRQNSPPPAEQRQRPAKAARREQKQRQAVERRSVEGSKMTAKQQRQAVERRSAEGSKMTAKQRRRAEREERQRERRVASHFYSWANVKNKRLAERLGDKKT